MNLDVTPILKTDGYGACGCGCGREGRLRKKPWNSNGVLCTINCNRDECRQCRGSAANSLGRSKQQAVRPRVGAQSRYHGAGHEENWQGPWRSEVKSGVRDAQVVATAYERERRQSDGSKRIGDPRPFVPAYAPKGTRRSYHIIRDDELEHACVAYCESVGYRVEPSGHIAS